MEAEVPVDAPVDPLLQLKLNLLMKLKYKMLMLMMQQLLNYQIKVIELQAN
jgi:hypothetical protein